MTVVEQPGAGWDVLASDGSVVRIRPVRVDDEPALQAMNSRVSDESIYLRFFGMNRMMADEYTNHLATEHDGHVALIAEYADDVVGNTATEISLNSTSTRWSPAPPAPSRSTYGCA